MPLIAVIADMHLPEQADTLKDIYLDKALEQISCNKPDILLVAGDITASGDISALKRFQQKISAIPFAKLSTVGNSDLRTPETINDALKSIGTGGKKKFNDSLVVMLSKYDSGKDLRLLNELENNASLPFVICSHFSLTGLGTEIRSQVEKLLKSGKGIFIAGHLHQNTYPGNNESSEHVIRGLDPDKASGGPPCVTYFELINGKWKRKDNNLDQLQPEKWSDDIRLSLLSKFGFSTMSFPLAGLKYAQKALVPCLELRAGPASAVNRDELQTALRKWREAVPGSCMSVHLHDVDLDNAGKQAGFSYSPLKESVELAVKLNANQATVHLPGFEASLQNDLSFFDRLIADYAEILAPLAKANITINFENMHLTESQKSKKFGCTPVEAVKWINRFKVISNYPEVGFLMDIGHARNNGIYQNRFNISQWFALTGHLIKGYHLHQVKISPEGMCNHCEFDSPYGKLIPLTSFFAAWHENLIPWAPVFLEIRGPVIPASFELLRNYLVNAGKI